MDNFTPLKTKNKKKANKLFIFASILSVFVLVLASSILVINNKAGQKPKATGSTGCRQTSPNGSNDLVIEITNGTNTDIAYELQTNRCFDGANQGKIPCEDNKSYSQPSISAYSTKTESFSMNPNSDCGSIQLDVKALGGEFAACYAFFGNYPGCLNRPTEPPGPTDIPTNTPIPTLIPTDVPTITPIPTATGIPILTNTPTPIPTNTATPTPTRTPTPTPTTVPGQPTNTPAPTLTSTPTPTPTGTPGPTLTPVPVLCGTKSCDNTTNPCRSGYNCVQANDGSNYCSSPDFVDACKANPSYNTCCIAPGAPTATPTEIILAKASTSPTTATKLLQTGVVQSFMYFIPVIIILFGLIL